MLKRGLLFLFVFIISLEISLAQENTCTVASPDSVAHVAQRILNIYSQIDLPRGVTPQQAAIDSVNRWQPSGDIDPNWVNFKEDLISVIPYFASFNSQYRCSEFVEDFTGDTLMQGDRIISRCNQEGKHCVYTKDGAGCVDLDRSIYRLTSDIAFSERHNPEAYNQLLEIKDLRSIETLLFFYVDAENYNGIGNAFPLFSAISETGRQGVERILNYLPDSRKPINILGLLEEFEDYEVVEPLYTFLNDNVRRPDINPWIARTLIKFNQNPIVIANYRKLISVSPDIRITELVPVLLQIPEFNSIYQELIREGHTEHEARSIIFVSDRYNQNNPGIQISDATEIIKAKRDSFKRKVILGPGVTLIQIFHNPRLDTFASSKGVTNIVNRINGAIYGDENKDELRRFIRESVGPTTLWIGSGSGDGDGVSIGNNFFHISYQELGDDLSIRSGNLEDVVVILDACYTYNMAENLRNYLRNIKGVVTFPTIISVANKDSIAGYSSIEETLFGMLGNVVGSDRIVLGGHILKVDEFSSENTGNDLAVFFSEDNNLPLEIAMNSLNPTKCGCTGDSCPIQPITS